MLFDLLYFLFSDFVKLEKNLSLEERLLLVKNLLIEKVLFIEKILFIGKIISLEKNLLVEKFYFKKKSNIRETYSKKIRKRKNYTNNTIKDIDIAP